MENYYEILQIKNFAEEEVIKASYKALCKKYHPDINKSVDPKIIEKINNAYDILKDSEKKKIYDAQLKKYLDLEATKKINESTNSNVYSQYKTNVNSFQESNYSSNKNEDKVSFIRILLAILIGVIFAFIGSYIILGMINLEGSWSYIVYVIYGYLIGTILSRISKVYSPILGCIGAIITVICMILPYYQYLYDTLPLIYGHMDNLSFFMKSTKEIIHLLLGSGYVRMFMILATPLATYSSIVD